MVYRVAAGYLEPKQGGKEAPRDIVRLDVSGPSGRPGANGASGASGGFSGGDGMPGQPAGPAEPGANGGLITAELTPVGSHAVRVRGTTERAGAGRFDDVFPIGDHGDVVLVSRGGAGGSGGTGGNGGSGARGRSGSDATRYTSGSSGGRGGDGGPGAPGTDGANGGRGGVIEVHLAEAHMQLAMLVGSDVRGGAAGLAGAHGQGGSGGPGGRGGSSYSWTETEHYTDSNGQSQTRTHHHSNSGGSDGPRGAQGSTPMSPLKPGQQGRDGKFEFVVHASSGSTAWRYPSCFDLALTGIAHESENKDGIYEPGERVEVTNLEVRNMGGMPTPSQEPITIALVRDGWVEPEAAALEVAGSIAPGERRKLTDKLYFRIGQYTPQGPADPLESGDTIHLAAWIEVVRRRFGGFERTRPAGAADFKVRFPVECSPIESLHALAPGESTRVAIKVKNISTRALGMRSEQARILTLTLSLSESEVGEEHLEFVADDGRRVSLARGHKVELETLAPGEERVLTGTLRLAATAPHYRAVRLVANLELGRLDAPHLGRTVQLREFVVRVARRYVANPDAEVILVLNNHTTRDELEAWQRAADSLGVKVNTWDVSLEGHLELDSPSGKGAGALRGELVGKGLVFLAGTVDTRAGAFEPRTLLSAKDAIDILGAGALVVLAPTKRARRWLGTPSAEPSTAIEKSDAAVANPIELASALAVGVPAERISLTVDRYFFKPKLSDGEARAAEIARSLDAAYPERRHLVVYESDIGLVAQATLKKTFSLGTVRVVRGLDVAMRPPSVVFADEDLLSDPGHVEGVAGPAAIMSALSPARRFEVLFRELSTTSGAMDESAPPLLVDLAKCDVALEVERMFARPRGDDPTAALANLRAWMAHVPHSAMASEAGDAVIDLAALVRSLASGFCRFWHWLPPWIFTSCEAKLRRALKALANDMLRAAFASSGEEAAPRPIDKRVRATVKRLAREHRSSYPERLRPRGQYLVGRAVAALAARGVAVDDPPTTSVVDAVEHKRALKQAERREARGDRATDALRSARADLGKNAR
ncbi:MAG: hypothetical protein U0271_02745 [Polyangiaceae bacterium]